ncbi:DUF397 domain-containing protein [Streptomyces sp. NPDC057620]|uniref:DUF397 domain-containing protein n=1 Tax=Streptomyces sp. NPDC057620 TaxID=3346185 RepID=UPI0036CC6619
MDEIRFHKSSYCTDAHGCVEMGAARDAVQVRDSKEADGPRLTFGRNEWSTFVTQVKASGLPA